MEIVIGALAAGLLVSVIFSIKFIFEPSKKDFKEDLDRQSTELKKALTELQRVESAYQEARNNAEAVQKENAALAARLEASQKSRDDEGQAEQELKQKVASLEGNLASRVKELNDRTKKAQDLEKKLEEKETQGKVKLEASKDLENQAAHFKEDLDRQSTELKKALTELQRVESAYQEAKNNAEAVQKENAALAARLEASQKSRDDEGQAEQELKQKVASLEGKPKKNRRPELEEHIVKPETRQARVTETQELSPKPANLEPIKTVTAETRAQKQPQETPDVPFETLSSIQQLLHRTMEKHDRRIGDILMTRKLITKENLYKALDYQKRYGGNVTQYLLYFGYINEKDLAYALAQQFKVPYIPLSAYDISEEVVRLISVDIAEKYWVMPVDQNKNSLVVAMIDPLDIDVHKDLQRITGLEIIPFVSIISEIIAAHRIYYYKILTQDQASKIVNAPLFFLNTENYTGLNRRKSVRYMAKIDVRFLYKDHYITSQTIDVSRGGFAFMTKESIELGATLTIEINLSREVNPNPISILTQVVRCVPVFENSFQIGVKILKISKEENDMIVTYASMHKE